LAAEAVGSDYCGVVCGDGVAVVVRVPVFRLIFVAVIRGFELVVVVESVPVPVLVTAERESREFGKGDVSSDDAAAADDAAPGYDGSSADGGSVAEY